MGTTPSVKKNMMYRDDSPIYISADTELEIGSQIVRATVNTASDNITCTLPPVGPAAGSFIYISCDVANAKKCTVEDNNNDAGFTDVALDTDEDYLLLFSTGSLWKKVLDGEA